MNICLSGSLNFDLYAKKEPKVFNKYVKRSI